jgi:hypothetical protein
MGKIFINVYYKDSILQTNEYENPTYNNIKNFPMVLGSDIYRKLSVNYKNVVLESDNGWLFSNITEYSNIKVESIIPETSGKVNTFDGNQVVFEVSFYASHFKLQYNRKYAKIQDILANLGGIFKALIFILELSFNYFLVRKYYVDLFNTCYPNYIPDEKRNIIQDTFNKMSKNNFIEKQNIKSIENLNTENAKIKYTNTQANINIEKKDNFIQKKVSFIYFCCNKIKCRNKLTRSYHKFFFNVILSKLSIDRIISKGDDVDKIKCLLLPSEYRKGVDDFHVDYNLYNSLARKPENELSITENITKTIFDTGLEQRMIDTGEKTINEIGEIYHEILLKNN